MKNKHVELDSDIDSNETPKKIGNKKHKKSEENMVPSPIKVKIEKVKKNKHKKVGLKENSNGTSSEIEQEHEETMVPTPIRVKAEEVRRKSGPKNTPVPQPTNIKIEQKNRRHESEDSSEEVPVPAPIQVKTESRKRKTTKMDEVVSPKKSKPTKNENSESEKSGDSNDSDTDSSEDTVPLPKIIKSEPRSSSNSSNSAESSSEEEITPESIKVKMDYLNNSAEKPPKSKNYFVQELQSKYTNIVKHQILLEIPETTNCFLLRVPKTIDPVKLIHLPWDLDKKLKFNLLNKKEKYLIKPLKENPDPCYVIGNNAKVLNINKIYTVTKHISKKQASDFELPIKSTVPLPDNIKTRHPLFGIAYKSKIKLKKAVKNRLKEAVNNVRKQNLKELKKKKSKKVKEETEESRSELIFDMLKSHTSRKL